jgi:hypothetical protein
MAFENRFQNPCCSRVASPVTKIGDSRPDTSKMVLFASASDRTTSSAASTIAPTFCGRRSSHRASGATPLGDLDAKKLIGHGSLFSLQVCERMQRRPGKRRA